MLINIVSTSNFPFQMNSMSLTTHLPFRKRQRFGSCLTAGGETPIHLSLKEYVGMGVLHSLSIRRWGLRTFFCCSSPESSWLKGCGYIVDRLPPSSLGRLVLAGLRLSCHKSQCGWCSLGSSPPDPSPPRLESLNCNASSEGVKENR